MFLKKEEEEILAGDRGRGPQRAMELLLAIGTVYEAERLVPITSAHLSGVSYKTIGEGGLSFLKEMAEDSRVSVPTTLNPSGMDLGRWREMGVSKAFAQRQLEIVASYERMGVNAICTCTPYLAGNLPRKGDSVSWAESSALSFINSVVGARTNREGGPGALAAAILGKTPLYGLHLEENRAATVIVDADIDGGLAEYSLLGHAVGKSVGSAVPYFRGIAPSEDETKIMAAAMAAAGSVAMFHVEGLTPESPVQSLKGLERVQVDGKDISSARDSLTTSQDPDLIALGCPHLSVGEIRDLAAMVKGKRKAAEIEVWFCTSRAVRDRCPKEVAVLERFGKVVCDTCMVVAPIEDHHRSTGTNSAKACTYLPTLCSQKVMCRSSAELMELIL